MQNLDLNYTPSETQIIARVYDTPILKLPTNLYIDPLALRVFLEIFEGPLDLLLYLIKRQNIDIVNIKIVTITEQYISYINEMQNLNINLASEYLLMAATLLNIKSKLLIPNYQIQNNDMQESECQTEINDAINMKEALILQLLEYEKIKILANQLYLIPQVNKDFVWINLKAQHTSDAANFNNDNLETATIDSIIDNNYYNNDNNKLILQPTATILHNLFNSLLLKQIKRYSNNNKKLIEQNKTQRLITNTLVNKIFDIRKYIDNIQELLLQYHELQFASLIDRYQEITIENTSDPLFADKQEMFKNHIIIVNFLAILELSKNGIINLVVDNQESIIIKNKVKNKETLCNNIHILN